MPRVAHATVENPTVKRGLTAMRRFTCSRPIALATAEGVIRKGSSVFDYGCGHGADVRYLTSRSIKVSGWDPQHHTKGKVKAADVVNLGFVLNVIEDQAERLQTLQKAFTLAKRTLIVSVRVDNAIEAGTSFADGVITSKQTFQKIYSQEEFLGYLGNALNQRVEAASLGIAYVFKDETEEARYLANRAFTRRLEYRTDLIEEFSKHPLARRFVKAATKLGRMPIAEEFPNYDHLLEAFGSHDRIERLTLRHLNREAFEGSQAQRRGDILTYLAMLRLQGMRPPPFSVLPVSVQKDVKVLWRSYQTAQAEGDAFLFSLGRPDVVRTVCTASSVGKLLPEDLYAHRSAEADLPALARLLIAAAKRVVGEPDYNLVKIALDGRAVSFLTYKDFDEDPHPVLLNSLRVYLPRSSYSVRDYSGTQNAPILHRKETLVSPDYPLAEQFRQLTVQEEDRGLLSAPGIGTREAWKSLLEANHLSIEGHRVVDGASIEKA